MLSLRILSKLRNIIKPINQAFGIVTTFITDLKLALSSEEASSFLSSTSKNNNIPHIIDGC